MSPFTYAALVSLLLLRSSSGQLITLNSSDALKNDTFKHIGLFSGL
jgi:hypothetical protein